MFDGIFFYFELYTSQQDVKTKVDIELYCT